ncbi:MAG: AAA family ATPase [Peptostreptococcaceae bacterium]|nr:AAA family ATPase [Peptostreptococcaceae bacterium]
MKYTEKQRKLLALVDQLEKRVGSQSKVCELVGITPGIMTPLRKGTYGGNIEAQFAKLEQYFAVKEEAAKGFQEQDFVPTSVSTRVMEYIRSAQIKGGLLPISGDAGIGKTRAIRQFCKENPTSCIWITANPCLNTVKPILKRISKALGVNARTNDDMYMEILEKLRDGMVIIFDEAQHLSLKVIETVRGFSDYFSDRGMTLGIVFVGNSSTISRFGGKEDAVFEQIANRTIQKPIFRTTDIRREDILLLYPALTGHEMETDFMLGVAQSREGLRGANNLYGNTHDYTDGKVTYDALIEMAKQMKLTL